MDLDFLKVWFTGGGKPLYTGYLAEQTCSCPNNQTSLCLLCLMREGYVRAADPARPVPPGDFASGLAPEPQPQMLGKAEGC